MSITELNVAAAPDDKILYEWESWDKLCRISLDSTKILNFNFGCFNMVSPDVKQTSIGLNVQCRQLKKGFRNSWWYHMFFFPGQNSLQKVGAKNRGYLDGKEMKERGHQVLTQFQKLRQSLLICVLLIFLDVGDGLGAQPVGDLIGP